MASNSPIDAQFHRAVDLVQGLPKSGPVQTSYEEKLQLYSLYKQATEGDISAPRPGMLDMLGRAKWDSWAKVKGVRKQEAKHRYVTALITILQRFADRDEEARRQLLELEALEPLAHPLSPTSSTSSFHSSRASPPPDDRSGGDGFPYSPPDPRLPAPDVAPNIIPPSALNVSHRSLVTLGNQYGGSNVGNSEVPVTSHSHPPSLAPGGPYGAQYRADTNHPFAPPPSGSRPQSLFGGIAGSMDARRRVQMTSTPSLGFVPEQYPQQPQQQPRPPPPHAFPPIARDFGTPDYAQLGALPGLPTIHSPYSQLRDSPFPQRPTSASTFSQPPLNLPATLQQIHTSLQALHERLTTLERTQAILLRRDEKRRSSNWSWFGNSADEEDLDDAEMEAERDRWPFMHSTTVRVRGRKKGLTVRVVWALITAVRRAVIGLGATMLVTSIAIMLLNGGWRRQAQLAWRRTRVRLVKYLADT